MRTISASINTRCCTKIYVEDVTEGVNAYIAGQVVSMTANMALDYYREQHDGSVVYQST